MRVHYLQHVPFEDPGSIKPWVLANGHKLSSTLLFKLEKLPHPEEIDMLIVMGGPMSVNDEREFPWLVNEKLFIKECVESGKSVLGICLGAQLIANAMGAKVYRNHFKEIGWFPVKGIFTSNNFIFKFPPVFEAFHWHGETFNLPEGAVHIAKSEGCENQAFQLGRSVIGLQFHLEATPETVGQLVANCRKELQRSKYVQSEEEIIQSTPERYKSANELMSEVLSFLTR